MNGAKAYRGLSAMYLKGEIIYPRVDNSYITHKPFDRYPHPELSFSGKSNSKWLPFMQPLERPFYQLNKNTALLELSNQRIVTPAGALSMLDFINDFFDFTLKLRTEMRRPASVLMGELHRSEDIFSLRNKEMLSLRNSAYGSSRGLHPVMISKRKKKDDGFIPKSVTFIGKSGVRKKQVDETKIKRMMSAKPKRHRMHAYREGKTVAEYDSFSDFIRDFVCFSDTGLHSEFREQVSSGVKI